jgi:hypothetical protein
MSGCPLSSALAIASQSLNPIEIGRRFGVQYVVTGDAFIENAHLQVAATLVRAEDGERLWSEISRAILPPYGISSEKSGCRSCSGSGLQLRMRRYQLNLYPRRMPEHSTRYCARKLWRSQWLFPLRLSRPRRRPASELLTS